MDLKYLNRDKKSESSYPLNAYYIAKFLNRINPVVVLLDKIETLVLSKRISNCKDESPIYITGLARAGTTIILEMLSKHSDIATHRYIHMPMSYLPYIWTKFARKTKIFLDPVERIHNDGIMVNRESPEALEEVIWRQFFEGVHKETISNVLDHNVSNSSFEKFYRNHISKMLLIQKKSRYLTKNNYNVTRMEYLLKLFPKAKFLLIIRNPVNHIASLIKQNKLFEKIGVEDPRLEHFTQLIGHYEFGRNRKCINVGDHKMIENLSKIWLKNSSDEKAWALYWASIYSFVSDALNKNKKLGKATLIVRYDDLVNNPSETIDKILDHTHLKKEKFKKIKKYYIKNLHKPTYYQANFSKQELKDIAEITDPTASLFGYL
ncbi:MAG: sulfotransferase family protein [Promethearchaeota archaeon]